MNTFPVHDPSFRERIGSFLEYVRRLIFARLYPEYIEVRLYEDREDETPVRVFVNRWDLLKLKRITRSEP